MNSPSKQCPACAGKGSIERKGFLGILYSESCPICKGTGNVPTGDRPEPEGGQPAVTQAARRSLPALAKVRSRLLEMREEALLMSDRSAVEGHWTASCRYAHRSGALAEALEVINEEFGEEPEGNEQS